MSEFCKCMEVRKFGDAVRDIADEAKEVVEVKSLAEFKDEMSDVMWGIGRLIAGLHGKVYFHVIGDGAHYKKVEKRMAEYGCVRSKRHLVNGKCPCER